MSNFAQFARGKSSMEFAVIVTVIFPFGNFNSCHANEIMIYYRSVTQKRRKT